MAGSNVESDGPLRQAQLDELQAKIAHAFERVDLLERALTHPSYAHETNGVETDNQRLEFLGDAVLGLVVARRLYGQFRDENEGTLSRFKAALVCEDTLASMAEDLALGPLLRLGRGERASGGEEKSSILSDAVEALFAAIYLDGGYEAAEAVIQKLLESRLEDARRGLLAFDSKTALQELAQSKGGDPPLYDVADRSGPPHSRVFTVEVRLGDEVLATGTGRSKKAAQKKAAAAALRRLRVAEEAGLEVAVEGLESAAPLDTPESDEHDSQ